MTAKAEKILTREAFIILFFLITYFLSTFYMDSGPLIKKLNYISFYGYPVYLLIRFSRWVFRFLRGFLKINPGVPKVENGKKPKINIEKIATRELFILLVVMVVYFLTTFYADSNPLVEKLNFAVFYGYPVYLLARLVFLAYWKV